MNKKRVQRSRQLNIINWEQTSKQIQQMHEMEIPGGSKSFFVIIYHEYLTLQKIFSPRMFSFKFRSFSVKPNHQVPSMTILLTEHDVELPCQIPINWTKQDRNLFDPVSHGRSNDRSKIRRQVGH